MPAKAIYNIASQIKIKIEGKAGVSVDKIKA